MLTLKEKKELFLMAYEKSFDYNLCIEKIGFSDSEREEIKNDDIFQFRLKQLDIELKETVFTNVKELIKSENPGVRLRATELLGKLVYPEKFLNKNNHQPVTVDPVTVVLKGRSKKGRSKNGTRG